MNSVRITGTINPRIEVDLDELPNNWHHSIWHCQQCGRIYGQYDNRICPNCGKRLEFFSVDIEFLSEALEEEFDNSHYEHKIFEKYQIYDPDNKSFEYWDIFVWLYDKSTSHGYGLLIEVKDPKRDGHADYLEYGEQKDRATKNHFKNYRKVIDVVFLSNDECVGKELDITAKWIVKDMGQQLAHNIRNKFGSVVIPDWVNN